MYIQKRKQKEKSMRALFVNIKTFKTMLCQLMAVLNRKQRFQCALLFVGIFIASMLETLGVSAIIPFVLVLFSPDTIMDNPYIKILSDTFGITTYEQLIVVTALLIIAVYILKNVALLIYQYFQGKFHSVLEKDITVMMFKAYVNRPYSFFLKTNSAEMLRGVSGDIMSVAQVLDGFCGLFAEVITCLMIGVFLICMDPLMAIGLVGIALIVALIMILGFKKKTAMIGEKTREYYAEKSKIALQTFSGMKEVKVADKGQFFIGQYEDINTRASKLNTSYLFIQKVPARVIETVFIGCLLGMSCFRIIQGGDTTSFVTVLSALAMAAVRILPSISSITGYVNTLVYNRIGMEAAYKNISFVKNEIKNQAAITTDAETEKRVCKEAWNTKLEDRVSVKDVSFRYEGANRDVLKQISLDIRRGESVGIIGESGAGKSTFLDVLLGLLLPKEGEITIDGKDISSIKKHWATMIGYVPQNVYMLDDTVRRNIAFGVEDEDISDEKIWQVLREAKLDVFIKGLEEGLDTTIGERGVRFSGGQRQRLAIARALYHDPDILILDEATSALDNETEKEVMQAIEELQGKITMVIVAHRLSTIEKCDRVYQIVGGTIETFKE